MGRDACVEGETLSVSGHKLNLSECKIRGVYQLENMAAAALACKALGVSGGESLQALKSYEPLRFRMQYKGEKQELSFITTPMPLAQTPLLRQQKHETSVLSHLRRF